MFRHVIINNTYKVKSMSVHFFVGLFLRLIIAIGSHIDFKSKVAQASNSTHFDNILERRVALYRIGAADRENVNTYGKGTGQSSHDELSSIGLLAPLMVWEGRVGVSLYAGAPARLGFEEAV